jgi:glycosyltransferase involved in cell wall biosynthesis
MQLSIISPVYKAEAIVSHLVERTRVALEPLGLTFEIILVEDGGGDSSWEEILKIAKRDPRIKGVKLSRNFGQHYAVTAGLHKASGDLIVIMDCDLQDGPDEIPKLIEEQRKGVEIVFTKRKKRSHTRIKAISSSLYNLLFKLFSDGNYDINYGSLVLFSRKVANSFLQLREKDRLYIQILKWLGFPSSVVEVEHHPRFEGRSSYSLRKIFNLGLQGWTSHSTKLLKLSTYFGMLLSIASFACAFIVVCRYLLYDLLPGWPSIIVTILFSTGLILMSIGVLGIYIGKIFEQVKDRPLFIVEQEVNLGDHVHQHATFLRKRS